MTMVLGLDLSYTCTGGCLIDTETWDCEIGRARCFSFTTNKGLPDLHRAMGLARMIEAMCKTWQVGSVWIEGYAFSKNNRAHMLGELGGIVKSSLLAHMALDPHTANMNSARKLLLGKVPRSDVKVHVQTYLRRSGLSFDNDNEADAFCVANFGLSELGFGCLIGEAA